MSPSVSQANEVFSPAAAEEAKEDEEETANLSSVLEQLGLTDYLSTFEQEKIDVESLVRANFIFFFLLVHLVFLVSKLMLCLSAAYVHNG